MHSSLVQFGTVNKYYLVFFQADIKEKFAMELIPSFHDCFGFAERINHEFTERERLTFGMLFQELNNVIAVAAPTIVDSYEPVLAALADILPKGPHEFAIVVVDHKMADIEPTIKMAEGMSNKYGLTVFLTDAMPSDEVVKFFNKQAASQAVYIKPNFGTLQGDDNEF